MAMMEQSKIRQVGREQDTDTGEVDHNHQVSSNDLSSCCCLISKLPDSILREIFFRLPIKSVTRCTSVCRAWLSIISESDFSDCFVKNSNFRPLLYHPCYDLVLSPRVLLLLQISDKGGSDYDCIGTIVDPKIPDWPEKQPYFTFRGSCNGFICMSFYPYPASDVSVYVSNPVTGECFALPERTVHHKNNRRFSNRFYFGFSPSDNKFKVLEVPTDERLDWDVEIVTVGVDDKWRRLSSDICRAFESFRHKIIVFCSGMFHWIPGDCYETPGFISAFDLGEESLGQFRLPPGYRNAVLRTFENQLCVIDDSKESSIKIWVMKEHAVPESWTAILIRRRWIPPEIKSYSFNLNPVAQFTDGRILFAEPRNNYLMSFDVKEKKFSRVDIYVPNSTPRLNDVKTCAALNFFHPVKKG